MRHPRQGTQRKEGGGSNNVLEVSMEVPFGMKRCEEKKMLSEIGKTQE